MANRLGDYLRELRLERGLTTRQLSDRAECSHAFITLLETGDRSPSLGRLWLIVQALEGDFGQALYLLCLDADIPEAVAGSIISRPSSPLPP